MATDGELPLMAAIPAAELARMRRRMAYLEAAVVQVLRDERGLREWFGATDLAALRLPGLPMTAQGIARMARQHGWSVRQGEGRARLEYHFSDLPRPAFAALIDRVMRPVSPAAAPNSADLPVEQEPARPAENSPPQAAQAKPANTTPTWVLPLLRLLKAGAGPLAHALDELPARLPPGEACPSLDEARAELKRIGIGGD